MSDAPSGVDWDLAMATATRLVRPGPEVSTAEAGSVVAELRDAAQRAESYVTEVTGLRAEPSTAPVLVVDRPGWIRANIDAFSQVLAPLSEKLPDNGWISGLGARASGVQVGVLLSYLAPKILGQFDPYFEPSGRLLLVAPNVVQIERELRVPASDFRLWVCLHEETHRVQFSAVPWLREHLRAQIDEVVGSADLSPEALGQALRHAIEFVTDRNSTHDSRPNSQMSLLDLVQTPEQRAMVDRITAVMTLLEGHADMMMDQVGPDVIASIVQIRARFTDRRRGQGVDRIIRRLLGLDAKMRQYRDGAAFCTAVIAKVGLDGFNRVWTAAETLPTRAEILAPHEWVNRVCPVAPQLA